MSKRGNKPTNSQLSSSTFPENLGFLWSIDEATATEGLRGLKVSGSELSGDHAAYNFPPRKKNSFMRREGNVYQWRNGESKMAQITNELKRKLLYSTASVCFQPRQDNFLALDGDCTQQDLSRKADHGKGWCQVRFNHIKDLSEAVFVGQTQGLAARAGPAWMPQVLPAVYECFSRRNEDPSGGLCGKLAILIGMAAFSAESSISEEVVQKCFGKGEWIPHDQAIGVGRYNKYRVVIVNIYRDSGVPHITDKVLSDFEAGKYGPIITAVPRSRDARAVESNPNYITSSGRLPNSIGAIPRTNLMMHGTSTMGATPIASTLSGEYGRVFPNPPSSITRQPPTQFGIPRSGGMRLPDDEHDDDDYYQSDDPE